MNIFPWDPARFRDGNYIDAMALVRTAVLRELGGYRTDRRLHGWEDFDLWAADGRARPARRHVPRVVARYRTSDHSMLSATNISGAEARSMVAAAAPTIMADPDPAQAAGEWNTDVRRNTNAPADTSTTVPT